MLRRFFQVPNSGHAAPRGAPSIHTERDVDTALQQLCSLHIGHDGEPKRLADEHFLRMTPFLVLLDEWQGREGDQEAWEFRPRLYTLLRASHALALMELFVSQGFTDMDIPFDSLTLPNFVTDPQTRMRILGLQSGVLTTAHQMESREHHFHIEGSVKDYFSRVGRLGTGMSEVDQVYSRLSLKHYARKQVYRGRDSTKNRLEQQRIFNEIRLLKRLDQRHLIRIAGSYTDKDHIGILLEPVAQCNLHEFMNTFCGAGDSSEPKMFLRTFFGCLAGAVDYLHSKKVRHRDLKPHNILIKLSGLTQVYVADFDAALEWTEGRQGTTQHHSTPRTREYMAPETAKQGSRRNTMTDMWSLGLVFLEMVAVLKGTSPFAWTRYLAKKSAKTNTEPLPCYNIKACKDFLNVLRRKDVNNTIDNVPLAWITYLLEEVPENRLDSKKLVKDIVDSPYQHDFCCRECLIEFQTPGFFSHDHGPTDYEMREAKRQNMQKEIAAFRDTPDNDVVAEVPSSKVVSSVSNWLNNNPTAQVFHSPSDSSHFEDNQYRLPSIVPPGKKAPREPWRPLPSDASVQYLPIPGAFTTFSNDCSTDDEYNIVDLDDDDLLDDEISTDRFRNEQGDAKSEDGLNVDDVSVSSEAPRWLPYRIVEDDCSEDSISVGEDIEQSAIGFLTPIPEECTESSSEVTFTTQIQETSETHKLEQIKLSFAKGQFEHLDGFRSGRLQPFSGSFTGYHSVRDGGVGSGEAVDRQFLAAIPMHIAHTQYVENIGDGERYSNLDRTPIKPHDSAQVKSHEEELGKEEGHRNLNYEEHSKLELVLLDRAPEEMLHEEEPLGAIQTITVASMDKHGQRLTGSSSDTPETIECKIASEPCFSVPAEEDLKPAVHPVLDRSRPELNPLTAVDETGWNHRHNSDSSAVDSAKVLDQDGDGTQKSVVLDTSASSETPINDGTAEKLNSVTLKKNKKSKTNGASKGNPDTETVSVTGPTSRSSTKKPIDIVRSSKTAELPEDVFNIPVEPPPSYEASISEAQMETDSHKRQKKSSKLPSLKELGVGRETKQQETLRSRWTKQSTVRRIESRKSFALSVKNMSRLDAMTKPKKSNTMQESPSFDPGTYIDKAFENLELAVSDVESNVSENTSKRIRMARWMVPGGPNLLDECCDKGKPGGVKQLLRRGFNPGTGSKPSPRPLLFAMRGKTPEHNSCIRRLIDYGCDVNAVHRGRTPIHRLVENPHFDGYFRRAALLLMAAADLNTPDTSGNYCILKILGGPMDRLEEYRVQTLAMFLHKRLPTTVDVNVKDPVTLSTALHLAIRRRHPVAVAMLVHRGADVNAVDATGTTPLSMAANQWKGELSLEEEMCLDCLLNVGNAAVDQVSGTHKRTALHLAILAGAALGVEMLLEQDADSHMKDSTGKDAFALLKQAKKTIGSEAYAQIGALIAEDT